MRILGIVALILSALDGLTTVTIWHFLRRLRWFHDSLAESRRKELLTMGSDIMKGLDVAGDEIKELRKDISRIINSNKTIEAIDKESTPGINRLRRKNHSKNRQA